MLDSDGKDAETLAEHVAAGVLWRAERVAEVLASYEPMAADSETGEWALPSLPGYLTSPAKEPAAAVAGPSDCARPPAEAEAAPANETRTAAGPTFDKMWLLSSIAKQYL